MRAVALVPLLFCLGTGACGQARPPTPTPVIVLPLPATPATPACNADLDVSQRHCGACNHACVDDETCSFGVCQSHALSAADASTCQIVERGHVRCWGDNTYGGLGDGTTRPRSGAVRVASVEGALSVASDYAKSCALKRDRSIDCWGGGWGPRPKPFTSLGFDDATSIATTPSGWLCALRRGGTVSCVEDSTDALGQSRRQQRFDDIGGVTDAAQITASGCMVRRTGEVLCWGGPPKGASVKVRLSKDVAVWAVPGITDAVQASGDAYRTCIVRTTGDVACWRSEGRGAAGCGFESSKWTEERGDVASIHDAVEVSSNHEHGCAVRRTGKVSCWEWPSQPEEVEGIDDAVHVAAGRSHACATRRSGQTVCWGDRDSLARSRSAARHDLPRGIAARSIALGPSWVCALTRDDRTKCWGPAESEKTPSPVTVLTLAGIAAIDAYPPRPSVSLGGLCAFPRKGNVQCFSPPSTAAKTFVGLGPLRAILPDARGFALLESGALARLIEDSAVSNPETGATVLTAHPDPVSGVGRAVQIAGDPQGAVCAALSTGGVVCVELSMKNGAVVRTVRMPITDAVNVAYDGATFAVAHKSGAVSRWDAVWPVEAWVGAVARVAGVTDATQVVLSSGSACARLRSGAVACWGKNERGELGTGDFAERRDPVIVAGVRDVVQLGAGGGQVCALRTDGDVTCWGYDVLAPWRYAVPAEVAEE